jgi:hypothetical protein
MKTTFLLNYIDAHETQHPTYKQIFDGKECLYDLSLLSSLLNAHPLGNETHLWTLHLFGFRVFIN